MRRFFPLFLGAVLLFGILVLPNHPGTMRWGALNRWPLELPVILLLMVAVGRWRGLPSGLALVLVTTTVIKLADYGAFTAYNRTFNPVIDLFLIEAGVGLLHHSVGMPLTIGLVFASLLALVVLFVALRFGLQAWGCIPAGSTARKAAFIGSLACAAWAVADVGHHLKYWRFDKSPPGTAWTSRLSFKRVVEMQTTGADLIQFRRDTQNDEMRTLNRPLDKLAGRDVLLIWVESYGRASFDNPVYMPTHRNILDRAEAALRENGLAIKSGWLESPTAGGESWLAHGALASGLWTSDNGRYNAMIASGRKWLFHFAQEAGYRTSTFMPAITVGWPESQVMGFENIFAAADIPYRGRKFNWVTMPDQFTLNAYRDLLPPDPRAEFVQVALISSHAPWTPIPDLLPWTDLSDGLEFNEMATRGPTPRDLWKNRDDIRDAYRRAMAYSLEATFTHIARLGADTPLILVAGDHQAAGFVAGSDNRDVPMHVIGPPDLVEMINHWGWTDGLVPSGDVPARRMDRFRNDFLTAFTSMDLISQVQP